MLEGNSFLVTGATGRVGPHLCERLEELGARVTPLVLPGYPELPKWVPWRCASRPRLAAGAGDLASLEPPDYVLHLHWKLDPTLGEAESIAHQLEWNVVRPSFLWRWLRESPPRRFVNCSSAYVYSHLNGGRVVTADVPRPTTAYGIAKLAGEGFLDGWFDGVAPVTHLRLAALTSPGEHPTRLVARLLAGAFDGETIGLYGNDRVTLMHVDEATDLMIAACLHATREHYIVAGAEERVDEIEARFERLAGRTLSVQWLHEPTRPSRPVPVGDTADLVRDWVRHHEPEQILARRIADRG